MQEGSISSFTISLKAKNTNISRVVSLSLLERKPNSRLCSIRRRAISLSLLCSTRRLISFPNLNFSLMI
ncbi:hypothetical protein P8452_62131 [Trifolium repens]|nr:hypothetical protein P8452_19820 [Trifolium repens]WJX78959.1 hypothetical protein P8452_62131 [Trifolium repens]